MPTIAYVLYYCRNECFRIQRAQVGTECIKFVHYLSSNAFRYIRTIQYNSVFNSVKNSSAFKISALFLFWAFRKHCYIIKSPLPIQKHWDMKSRFFIHWETRFWLCNAIKIQYFLQKLRKKANHIGESIIKQKNLQ